MNTVKFLVKKIDDRGFYIVDTASRGESYLCKDGKMNQGVNEDCFWEDYDEALKFANAHGTAE